MLDTTGNPEIPALNPMPQALPVQAQIWVLEFQKRRQHPFAFSKSGLTGELDGLGNYELTYPKEPELYSQNV